MIEYSFKLTLQDRCTELYMDSQNILFDDSTEYTVKCISKKDLKEELLLFRDFFCNGSTYNPEFREHSRYFTELYERVDSWRRLKCIKESKNSGCWVMEIDSHHVK